MTITIATLIRVLLTVVGMVLCFTALLAWNRRRRAPEARIVTLLIASAAIYCIGYAGEVAQQSLPAALFWLHVEYFGIPWIPALWLLLARKQNGMRSNLALIFLVPAITFLGELSNSAHGLYDTSLSLVRRGPLWVVEPQRGPLAWLNLVYLFGALLYGAWLYIHKAVSSSRSTKRHAVVLAGSALCPLFGYFLYLCHWSLWGMDLAPLTLAVSVVLAYIAVFKFEYFDLVPMARSLVFNSMRDAAIVTDLKLRLVEFNPAAVALLPTLADARPGEDVASVLADTAVLEQICESGASQEIELIQNGTVQYFDVRVFPLGMEGQQQLGWAVIFANITSQRKLVEELRRHAETDELTGAANRRSFMTALQRESARSFRHQFPYSVIFVDLDYFKDINDRFGHAAGDRALCTVSERIMRCLRGSDLLCRYGGDEFAVLLPQSGLESAVAVAERIRSLMAESRIVFEGQDLELTVSIGVASRTPQKPGDWNCVLGEADRSLYSAKAAGRNRVATKCDVVPEDLNQEFFLTEGMA